MQDERESLCESSLSVLNAVPEGDSTCSSLIVFVALSANRWKLEPQFTSFVLDDAAVFGRALFLDSPMPSLFRVSSS